MGGTPTQARGSTRQSAPVVSTPAPTTATPAQSTAGNAAVADRAGLTSSQAGSPQSVLPESISLERAGVTFALPPETALTSGWNQLETQGRTQVWISVTPTGLQIRFSPALVVDAQWPLSNVEWSGVDYDFRSGRTTAVHLRSTQIGFSVAGTVESEVRGFVALVLAGSPLATAGYDPLADADLTGTLAAIQRNFQASASSGGDGGGGGLGAAQIGGLGAYASIVARDEIVAGVEAGGVRLPAGTTVDVSASIAGTMATVGSAPPTVQSIDVSSSGILLESDGAPVARLTHLRVLPGGRVDVTGFEPLGKLAEVGAGESFLRLIGLMVALRGGTQADLGRVRGDILEPDVVNGVAERKIEEALTRAVQSLLVEHADAIPGIDLRQVLGVAAPTRG